MNDPIVVFSTAQKTDMAEIEELVTSVGGDMHHAEASQFTVAYVKEHVVGCVRIRPVSQRIWMLASLAVSPRFQGFGIGTTLVAKCVASFRGRPIYLLCYADREGFYAKNGFMRIDPHTLPKPLQMGYSRALERSGGKKEVMAMILT